MRKLRFTITSLMIVGFLSATLFTSCGGKKEGEESTEQVESAEHPAEGAEHPSDGAEHPSDSTSEHPADTTATN